MNWQEEVAKCMTQWGFRTCKFNPCLYMHRGREMMCLVHGADFVSAGGSTNLVWLKTQLSKRFQIKTKLMGLKAGESREERILNRAIRVTPDGWEYEADQRHADLIIQDSGAVKLSTLSYPGTTRESSRRKSRVKSFKARKQPGSELWQPGQTTCKQIAQISSTQSKKFAGVWQNRLLATGRNW